MTNTWFSNMPSDWKITKLGSHFKCRNVKVDDTNYPPLSVTKQGILPQMDSVAKTDANDNRKQVLAGDFVINSRSDRKESSGLSELTGSVSLINTVLYQTDADYDKNYVGYLLKNYGFAEEFYRWGHGIVADLWTTRWQEMKNIEIPLPPLKEQKLIFDFLTNRTSKIDQLISNENSQIEKLKEYRQAIITKAVTKGLDPNVPMKDSGVEGIGEIPTLWNYTNTKYLFSIIAGGTPNTDDSENFDGNVIWITPADYKTEDVYVSKGKRNLSDKGLSSCSASKVPVGSIIFSKRAPIGSVAINSVPLCTNQGCLSCVSNKVNLNTKYFYYVMSVLTEKYELLGSGTTFKEISAKNFEIVKLPYPPRNEQDIIVKYLDSKCEKIKFLIKVKEIKIQNLQAYKQSLIYEYVTGKRRVCL